jgi:hypothetical protein
MEILAVVLALVSLMISGALGFRVLQLERRLQESRPKPLPEVAEPLPRPLQGLRIALAITQDHPHPVFVDLLKEQLFSEDVTEISVLSPVEATVLRADWKNGPDILVTGEIVSNGYAEIYYTADFVCMTAAQPVCTLIEKPPHGDRPSNLAIDLVARLKGELEKLVGRDDRRRAIRELQGS